MTATHVLPMLSPALLDVAMLGSSATRKKPADIRTKALIQHGPKPPGSTYQPLPLRRLLRSHKLNSDHPLRATSSRFQCRPLVRQPSGRPRVARRCPW
eukprot:scaffold127841_cov28-Tisochrysis_lutea.AAC.5